MNMWICLKEKLKGPAPSQPTKRHKGDSLFLMLPRDVIKEVCLYLSLTERRALRCTCQVLRRTSDFVVPKLFSGSMTKLLALQHVTNSMELRYINFADHVGPDGINWVLSKNPYLFGITFAKRMTTHVMAALLKLLETHSYLNEVSFRVNTADEIRCMVLELYPQGQGNDPFIEKLSKFSISYSDVVIPALTPQKKKDADSEDEEQEEEEPTPVPARSLFRGNFRARPPRRN
jgi:hypothetical protein